MIPPEILKKVKALEIKTRKVVNNTFSGEYHSVFKGKGISFAEVREYQAGDDIRSIDWNVTAKMGFPYVKLFEEERELTVILMLDLSASGDFGSKTVSKVGIAAEIAAVLGFSAINNNDRVGLLLFSDKAERYIPPKKGKNHMFRILRDIFYYQPESRKTNIRNALNYLLKLQKKRAIVFLISDFIDHNYEDVIKVMAKKHDLVPILIEDPKELTLPKSGLMVIEDAETQKQLIINTYSQDIRQRFNNIVLGKKLEKERLFKKMNVDYIHINIGKPYLDTLAKYFKTRIKKFR